MVLDALKSKPCFFHRVPLDEHISVSAGGSWPHRHISAPVSAYVVFVYAVHFYTSGKKDIDLILTL